jgi:hypothetical protein
MEHPAAVHPSLAHLKEVCAQLGNQHLTYDLSVGTQTTTNCADFVGRALQQSVYLPNLDMATINTGVLESVLKPGRGPHVTVWIRTGAGAAGHTYMEVDDYTLEAHGPHGTVATWRQNGTRPEMQAEQGRTYHPFHIDRDHHHGGGEGSHGSGGPSAGTSQSHSSSSRAMGASHTAAAVGAPSVSVHSNNDTKMKREGVQEQISLVRIRLEDPRVAADQNESARLTHLLSRLVADAVVIDDFLLPTSVPAASGSGSHEGEHGQEAAGAAGHKGAQGSSGGAGGGAAAASSAAATPHRTAAASADELPTLRHGDRNEDVRRLQRFLLHTFPAYNTYEATGFYGDQTAAGIAEFQRRVGITGEDANGRTVGPRTKAQLFMHGWKNQ